MHVLCFSAAPPQNVKTVTGGVGTIKRKRELRELLEQQDVNYEDDIFDSTPFKKKKDLKVCIRAKWPICPAFSDFCSMK